MTCAHREGRYVREGKKVTVFGRVPLSAKGTSTGSVTLSGLPYAASTGLTYYTGAVGYFGGTTSVTTMGMLLPQARSAVNHYNVSSQALVTDTNIGSAFEIVFFLSYEVA